MAEKRDLMPNSPAKWAEAAEPWIFPTDPVSPMKAEGLFIERAAEIGLRYSV